jgi:hypothetical protein
MSKVDMVLDDIWRTVNNIDECVYKIKNVADVLEIMAVAETTEAESGALWLMHDNLVQFAEKIEGYTQDLLDLRNMAQEENLPKVGTIKPKKGKK